ncbi:hypothetical protein [Agrococcus baldri]|uniref:Uncharacterized protein n=1 Tax=Agrococcus baldri TaxID=153730 RepID=A0AA87UYU5_9MICO|nr:hypothetical protein [Agrococcus baldri]GEK81632.1 hypothetical protein ABA31_29830 [Agrococcus baldri]
MNSPRSTGHGIRTSTAALVVAAGLLLTGCGLLPTPTPSTTPTASEPAPAPSASDEGTAQAEQCAQLMTDVQAIGADVARVAEMLGTDPLGALGLVQGITERVGELQTRVTDPALLERIEEIQAGWNALVDDATSGPAGIERAVSGFPALAEQVTALQEFCAGTA